MSFQGFHTGYAAHRLIPTPIDLSLRTVITTHAS